MKSLALTIPGMDGTPLQVAVPSGIPTGGISDSDGLQGIINITIGLLFVIGIVGAICMILFAGIQIITSGGDKAKLEGAKGRITWAIIGIVVLSMSFVIIQMVITLLGGDPGFFLQFTPSTPPPATP